MSARANIFLAREWKSAGALAALGFLSRLALAFRSPWQITSRPYLDDAFYAIGCARHLALGHGFTVDGVRPTNGVQPLICLLYAPGFLLGDRILGLRLTFLIGALVQAASTVAIAMLVDRMLQERAPRADARHAGIFAALLWTIIAPLADQNGSGLETGLVALLILLALLSFQRTIARGFTTRRALLLGAWLGLAVLARIDCALLVVAFVASEIIRTPKHAKYIALVTFTAALVSSPWWLYSYATFGSLMPMSGASESIGRPIAENLVQSAAAMADMMTVFFNHVYYSWPAWVDVAAFFALATAWWLVLRSARVVQYLREHYDLSVLAPLAFFCMLIVAFYNFFFSAPHFLVRYLNPLRMLSLILIALIASQLIDWIRERRLIAIAIPVAIAALAFSVYRYVNNFTAPAKNDFYPLAMWSRAHPGTMGCMQSGAASFFADSVINLDGKVNRDALRARMVGRIGEYIAREHITYLADWKPLVEPLVAGAAKFGAHYTLVDSIRFVYIYQRTSP